TQNLHREKWLPSRSPDPHATRQPALVLRRTKIMLPLKPAAAGIRGTQSTLKPAAAGSRARCDHSVPSCPRLARKGNHRGVSSHISETARDDTSAPAP